MAGNASDAEDALNTAMLRAFHGFAEQSVTPTKEGAWLSRILYNVCMDFHRERQRYVEPLEVPEAEPEPTLASVAGPPDEVLLERERAAEIRERVRELPLHLRMPVEMLLDGKSYGDIAKDLKLTNSNVRKRDQHARGRLRTSMADMRSTG